MGGVITGTTIIVITEIREPGEIRALFLQWGVVEILRHQLFGAMLGRFGAALASARHPGPALTTEIVVPNFIRVIFTDPSHAEAYRAKTIDHETSRGRLRKLSIARLDSKSARPSPLRI